MIRPASCQTSLASEHITHALDDGVVECHDEFVFLRLSIFLIILDFSVLFDGNLLQVQCRQT